MSILKAACIGIAGTFLALQFQNTRKEYGIYLGIAVSIFLFLGMSRNLSVIRETLELVGSFVKIDAVYLTAMLKILGVTYLAEFAAAICKDAGYQTIAGQIRNFVTDQFFYVLKVNKPVLASIIFLVLIAAVFSNFSEVFQNCQISQTAFFLVYLSVITVGIRNFQAAAVEVQHGLENLILFMRVLCPVYFVCMAVAVGSISAIAFYNLALFLIFLVELVILKWIVPLIQIALLMEILNNLTEEEFLSKAAELLRLVIGWSLKSLLALVTGIGFIERIISPAADQVKRSVWTKGVRMIPGIGDVVSGTSEVVLGSAVLLKNGVGIAGALLVTGVVMIPVINMGILTLLYKGTAALIQPVSDKRIVEAISFTGEGYHMLLKTVLATAVLFLVTLAVAASAAS